MFIKLFIIFILLKLFIMKKLFKITIEIDKSNVSGIDSTYRWTDMLFSTTTRAFDKSDIVAKFNEMMKMSKGFNMLTISLTSRIDDNNYLNREETICSARFVNNNSYTSKIDDIKWGKWNGYSYGNNIGDGQRDFTPSCKKDIYNQIESIVASGNAAFIEMLGNIN